MVKEHIKAWGQNNVEYFNYNNKHSSYGEYFRFAVFDVRGKSYFDYPYKYYCEDIGLRNARIGFRKQTYIQSAFALGTEEKVIQELRLFH